jgi:hypothetical protein
LADQYAPIPVKSKNPADISVRLRNVADTAYMGDATTPVVITVNNATLAVTQSGTWTVGLTNDFSLVDNAGFTDGTSRVALNGYIFDEVAGTALTENDVAAARVDSKRAQVLVLEDATTRGQRAAISAAGRLSVDGSGVTQPVSGTVTANQGTAAAGSSAWPITVTDTTNTVVKPGDATNNAVRVNVVAGGTGGGSSSPTSPQRSYLTISALAISTRTAMNFTEIGTTLTARLAQLSLASTVACKWELFTVANGTESATPVIVFFTNVQNPSLVWTPPHANYVMIAATAGADNYRVYVTNLDNTNAADVYATALWDVA